MTDTQAVSPPFDRFVKLPSKPSALPIGLVQTHQNKGRVMPVFPFQFLLVLHIFPHRTSCSNQFPSDLKKSIYFFCLFLCLSVSLCFPASAVLLSLNKPHQSTATTKSVEVFRDGPHHALLHLRPRTAQAWSGGIRRCSAPAKQFSDR